MLPSALLLTTWLGLAAAPAGGAPAFLPAPLDDGWARSTPAAEGFDDAELRARVAAFLESEANVHGVVVERHGRLVLEAYRAAPDHRLGDWFSHPVQFGPDVAHDARSVGKSVIGLLVGLAVHDGRLAAGVDARLVDLFPGLRTPHEPARDALTVGTLLTMSSGLRWQEGTGILDDEHGLMWARSPVEYVLTRALVAPPGTAFTYNSGGTQVLAELLTQTQGVAWPELARRALFEPMGIHDVTWVSDPWGRPMAYTGLRLRPRDMAKLGRLVLDRGRWAGRELIPGAWIDTSLRPRLQTGFEETGYGYFWWTGRAPGRRGEVRWAGAFGNGPQRIIVVPELDLTLVVTAGAYGNLEAAHRAQQFLREVVATVR